jgi:WD40 repeat protein
MNTQADINTKNPEDQKKYAYQVGGVLPPDHPTYVVRPADRKILEKLIAGEYCYLMSSPQTGKSSLVLRTIQALQAKNIACITLNLNKVVNNQITLDEWYDEVLHNLGKIWQGTNHQNKKPLWLLANDLTPAQRFLLFIEEVLLIQIPRQPIIILIDEIDQKQVNYPLTDLVNIVTHCYEKRWHDQNFRRITFGLFGRDIPEKLLTFCQPVEFTRFSWQEINSLLPGIAKRVTNSEQIINEILYWTEGQPLLTQKLCSLLINYLNEEAGIDNQTSISDHLPHDEDTSLVEELVRICVIEHWESQDLPEHFQIIRDRLMLNKNIINLLEVYRQVLHPPVTLTAFSAEFETVHRVGVVADQSAEQKELIACGLVRNVHGVLQAYNPIYEEIFNHDWIKEQIERIHHFLDDDLDDYSIDNYLSQPILQPVLNVDNSSNLAKIDHRYNTGNHQNSNNGKISSNDHQPNILPSLKNSNLSQNNSLNNSLNNLSNSNQAKSLLNSPKIRWLSILAIASIIAVLYGIWSQLNRANKQLQQAQQQLAIAQKGTQLERQGANALQQFNNNQLPALLSAMQAGMELNTLASKQQTQKNLPEAFPFNLFSDKKSQSSKQQINPTEYPSTSPILALQQILDQIHEKQQLKNIRRINYSPDGQWLGSIQTDGTAEILTAAGKVHAKLRGHQGKVTKIVFSPNNQYIATAGEDGTVRIWEKSGRLIGNFAAHQGNVWDVIFSPDSANFVSGGEDGMVQLGSINNANLQKIHEQEGRILDVTFSPDGEKIASASWDGTVKISNINGKGKPIILKGHEGSVETVQFNPDGESIVTAGWDGTVRIWHNKGKQTGKQQAKLQGKTGGVWTFAFSPNGEQIVTSGEDGNAYIWDNTGEQLNKLTGHQGMITSVIYSPDGQYISTADSIGVIRLWTNTGRLINLFNGHQGRVWDMNFSPNSQQLLTVGEDNIARIWQLKAHYLTNLPGNKDMFGTVNFSPDGQLLATGGIDGSVRIWDIQGKPIARFKGYLGMFQHINFSPDHQLLVTAGDDGPPRLWQISGKEVRAFTGGQGAIHLMRFSPDGKTLVSVNDQGNMSFWNQEGKILKNIKTNQGKILDVNFSRDGQFLATAGSDRTGQIWDRNGGAIAVLKGHEKAVNSINFNADGQKLLTGSADGLVRIWDMQGNLLKSFNTDLGAVKKVAFSQDNQVILSLGENDVLRMWDNTGRLFKEWQQVKNFRSDGQIVATLPNNNLQLWQVQDLNQLLTKGCDWLKDYLTVHPEEKKSLPMCKKSP